MVRSTILYGKQAAKNKQVHTKPYRTSTVRYRAGRARAGNDNLLIDEYILSKWISKNVQIPADL